MKCLPRPGKAGRLRPGSAERSPVERQRRGQRPPPGHSPQSWRQRAGGGRSGTQAERGRALECGLPWRGRLCTGVETSWGGVSPVPSAPPPGPLPSAFCELSELRSEVSRVRSLGGRQGQWKKAKARNVSRTCLPRQTADRCPVSNSPQRWSYTHAA